MNHTWFAKFFPMVNPCVHLFRRRTNLSRIDGSKHVHLLFVIHNFWPILHFFSYENIKSSWNEWITLPLRYCDIPRYAVLAFSIHELVSPSEIRTIGSSTISIFAADGFVVKWKIATTWKIKDHLVFFSLKNISTRNFWYQDLAKRSAWC